MFKIVYSKVEAHKNVKVVDIPILELIMKKYLEVTKNKTEVGFNFDSLNQGLAKY